MTELMLVGEEGRHFQLEVSSDLRSWTKAIEFICPATITRIMDAEGISPRFYRASLLDPLPDALSQKDSVEPEGR